MILPCLLTFLALQSDPASLTQSDRDPFQGPGESRRQAPCEPRGLHCVPWQDLRVTAIVTSPAGSVVSFTTNSGENWFAREGDKARNAVVSRIDPERRGVLLREPVPGTVAGFREIVFVTGDDLPQVREPISADPVLSITR